MSTSSSGVHRPEVATRCPSGRVVQLPAPRRLVRWPVSRSARYAAVTVVRLTLERLGQLALGGQADAQRQPAVGEQAAHRAGQRGVVGAAVPARQGVPLAEQPGQLASADRRRHSHLPRIGSFERHELAFRVAAMARLATSVTGRPAAPVTSSSSGLVLYGVSMALMVESGLGLDPWDVFHQGVAEVTGLSFGWVVILRRRRRSCCSGSRCGSGPASARSPTWS